MTPAADVKGIRLQAVLDQQAPAVSGDADRLQQVVWNLLSNAVKFTPKGGRVQVALQRVNSHLEIVVGDTGRGIAAEFVPHLFERFRQADSASRVSTEGWASASPSCVSWSNSTAAPSTRPAKVPGRARPLPCSCP